MSKIRSKNTKPELLIRKILFSHGFRFRLHDKSLPGSPDIILKKYKIVIFINGCFWHGHNNCTKFVIPKTRTEWWLNKINTNIAKDKMNLKKLRSDGWQVLTIWECQLKSSKLKQTTERIISKIKKNA